MQYEIRTENCDKYCYREGQVNVVEEEKKIEPRISKSETNSKYELPAVGYSRFSLIYFLRIFNLFRISKFEFRAWSTPRSRCAANACERKGNI